MQLALAGRWAMAATSALALAAVLFILTRLFATIASVRRMLVSYVAKKG